MKKLALTLTAVMVGLLLASQAFAWGPGWGRGGCAYREAGLEKLNLTTDQKTKIEAIQIDHEKAIRPLRDKMFDKSVELRKLWLAPTPDKDKIVATQKELGALRDTMQEKATVYRLEIRKVLTPEQIEQLGNAGWGRGPGFGPRGGMRGQGAGCPGYGPGPGSGMGLCQ
jgi:Spy/CpxP family protein refolding chaperone